MIERRKRLRAVPVTIAEAKAFVAFTHRHHIPPVGARFALGVAVEGKDEVCGVAMIGRPVARRLDDGMTAEVTRVATDGTPNACSFLYRLAWSICVRMGYARLISYTLPEEGGASLRGAGFRLVGKAGGGSWSVPSRPRVDKHPLQQKLRWEISALEEVKP